MSVAWKIIDEHTRTLVFLLALLYIAVQFVYLATLPLVMDEFQGAGALAQLRDHVPYREFSPYKTLLGYYVQLPALMLSDDPWLSLIAVKCWMAILNGAGLFGAGLLAARRYGGRVALLALLGLITMSTFLERSSALRVDMLTAWAGLFSLFALMFRRPLLAGALAGISVLISQKGAYFAIAGGLALGLDWLGMARDRDGFRAAVRYTVGAVAPIAAYVAFWSLITSFGAVRDSMFLSHSQIAFADLYEIRHYWFQTLFRNPLFYGLAVLSLGGLFARRRDCATDQGSRLLLAYSLVLWSLCLWHKQPWPYFFVILIPTCFVLLVDLLAEEALAKRSRIIVIVFVLAGIVWPLRRVSVVLDRDSSFQRYNVELAYALLAPGEPYLAGMELLHGRQQVPPQLAWLSKGQLAALESEPEGSLVEALALTPPKLLVWNYRFSALPRDVKNFMHENYAFLSGNILLYSPQIAVDATTIKIAFAGPYRLRGESGVAIVIDGQVIEDGTVITLEAGIHQVESTARGRLLMVIDEAEALLAPGAIQSGPLFDRIYDY